ncbi:MAG: class I SAM-dependent methyltransferase [Patescibacteria group bacterium]|jgi:hypothetical protein
MTLEDINFFKSENGRELWQRYESYQEEDLYRLLFKSAGGPEYKFLPGIVTLIKLRRQAAKKFVRAAEMLFTPLNLEQSTSEAISEHIARRFKPEWKIVDLTCGLGGNLIPLAQHCQSAVAVDKLDINIACAQANAAAYGVASKIEFIIGDAYENISSDADAFFLDPARDREGQTKTRSLVNSEPALLRILPEIFKITHNVGVKISPAFDYKELEALSEKPEIEIIAEDNNCKVAMLWFGELRTEAARRATILVKNGVYEFIDSKSRPLVPIVPEPGNFLYEPNKAIIKAHLIEDLAASYGLSKINRHLSFLTGDVLVGADKPGIFRVFKIKACRPFALKELKSYLKAEGIERVNIMTKRFPLLPEELYKKLKVKEGGDLFLIVTVLSDEERYYLLAERV